MTKVVNPRLTVIYGDTLSDLAVSVNGTLETMEKCGVQADVEVTDDNGRPVAIIKHREAAHESTGADTAYEEDDLWEKLFADSAVSDSFWSSLSGSSPMGAGAMRWPGVGVFVRRR